MASPAGEPVDFGHQVLRLDLGIGGDRASSGCSAFHCADLLPPGRGARGSVSSGVAALSPVQLVQLAEDALDVAHDGHFGRAVLADFRRIDIHVDHLGVRRERRQAAR